MDEARLVRKVCVWNVRNSRRGWDKCAKMYLVWLDNYSGLSAG